MIVTDEDVLCAKCGYSLKSLRDPGFCPDCGNKYFVEKNEGIRRPRSARLPMSGTAIMVAITTGMLGMIFCPCTGLAILMRYHSSAPSPLMKSMAVVMGLVAFGLLITFLVAAGLAGKEWWEMKKARDRMKE